ncbi:MAG: putative ABC transport system permease protein [Parcubacteria group bacterium Gr01-1014_31]|nr:MAG: putative ABC transport system permease protein [Parcubacteria group bacterium Gr01-1014_31]
MKLRDLLLETNSALTANKARSGLTILGIVIGIASVIAMVSIGAGTQSTIESNIEGLGSNLLTVLPGVQQAGRAFVSAGRGSAQTLTNDDAEALRSVSGVAAVSPEVSRRYQISATTGNNTNSNVMGAVPAYAAVHNVAVAMGTFITEQSQRSLGRVAVLGPTVSEDLFGEGVDPLGKTIRINRINFKVIGMLQTKGGSGFSNPDDMVFVPLSSMQKLLAGSDYVSSIAMTSEQKDLMASVQAEASALLTMRHRVATPDFSIISQADILGTLSQVMTAFTVFLASIAGISLVVGGIGIMNMMLTAVTERTREIGLRMALGAKRREVAAQFLAESIALTFIGGAVGIGLGWVIARLVSRLGSIATRVSPESVALAFGVAAAIGIVFGYYPARRAAKLNPIEALRHE